MQYRSDSRTKMKASRAPIIRTKLNAPRVSRDLLPRRRLFRELDRGAELSLTVVSAPAGYGKSTLVASWLATRTLPWAWLSLDQEDGDLFLFLHYFLAALERADEEAFRGCQALLEIPELPPVSTIAGVLLNALEELQDGLVMALDDFHLVRDSKVHELLTLLLAVPLEG